MRLKDPGGEDKSSSRHLAPYRPLRCVDAKSTPDLEQDAGIPCEQYCIYIVAAHTWPSLRA